MKSKEIVKVKKATTSFLNLVKVRESQLDAYWKRTSKKIQEGSLSSGTFHLLLQLLCNDSGKIQRGIKEHGFTTDEAAAMLGRKIVYKNTIEGRKAARIDAQDVQSMINNQFIEILELAFSVQAGSIYFKDADTDTKILKYGIAGNSSERAQLKLKSRKKVRNVLDKHIPHEDNRSLRISNQDLRKSLEAQEDVSMHTIACPEDVKVFLLAND